MAMEAKKFSIVVNRIDYNKFEVDGQIYGYLEILNWFELLITSTS